MPKLTGKDQTDPGPPITPTTGNLRMGIFSTIRDHAAIARGDFDRLFHGIDIPPLPAAVAALLTEIHRPEPDVKRLTRLLESDPEIVGRILRTVNSALFALRHEVLDLTHAVTTLGLKRIRSIIVGYTMQKGLPRPDGGIFDHEAFWTDSLLRALCARSLTARFLPQQQEEAFTTTLLSHVALPVLLTHWQQYYEPVVARWRAQPGRLSAIEQEDFGWDHAQASAWILQNWGFPSFTVCLVGGHHFDPTQIKQLELHKTIALPVTKANLLPSVLKEDPDRCRRFVETALTELGIGLAEWPAVVEETRANFTAVFQEFHLSANRAVGTFVTLDRILIEKGLKP